MTPSSCPHERTDIVSHFLPGDLKLAPSCSQCSIPMVIMRGEPPPNEPAAILVTYRCTQCGLQERIMMR
jgi:hypothetical protein